MKGISRLAIALFASSVACSSEPETPIADAAVEDVATADASTRDSAHAGSDGASGADGSLPNDAPSADDARPDASDAAGFDATDAPSTSADAGDAGGADVADAAVPDGACLLRYHDDVHFDGGADGTTGTECCYAAGGANTCDLSGRCGAAAGGGCCIVYSTPADQFPVACCHYENAINPPGDPRCNAIVDAGH